MNLEEIKDLVDQLDSSAEVSDTALAEAMLSGYVHFEKDGDRIIGMGWIFPRRTLLRRQAVIEDMIVDDAFRGKGLGRKILKGLVSWAKDEGIEVIELTSHPMREAANGLYKSAGFKLHETNHYLMNL